MAALRQKLTHEAAAASPSSPSRGALIAPPTPVTRPSSKPRSDHRHRREVMAWAKTWRRENRGATALTAWHHHPRIPGMPRLVFILRVATLALLSGCAEDTITSVPSEGTETTEAGTQSSQPAQATDDRAFDEARAAAVPLILKAMDELDQVTYPNTPNLSIDLRHVSRAKDLVGQAGRIFEGVDDEIAGYLLSAQSELIGAIGAIGGGYNRAGAIRALKAAADDIDAANGLLGLAATP
jgi:hypothetical protein